MDIANFAVNNIENQFSRQDSVGIVEVPRNVHVGIPFKAEELLSLLNDAFQRDFRGWNVDDTTAAFDLIQVVQPYLGERIDTYRVRK